MISAINAMLGLRNQLRQKISTRQYETLRITYYNLRQSPEYKAMKSEAVKKQWTPERRASVAEKARLQWANGPKRESFSSDAYRSKKSQQMKDRWQDPSYQQFISESAKAQWQDPSKRPSR
jgi:hypothetical protein